MDTVIIEPETEVLASIESRIECLVCARKEAAAARAAEAAAVLASRQQRLESALARLGEGALPVLEEVAAALQRRGFNADVTGVLDPPRITLRVAEPNGTSQGPPRVTEGCLTLTATADLTGVSVRQETWRWRVGGERRDCGTTSLDAFGPAWIRDRALEFLRQLLLGQDGLMSPAGAGERHVSQGVGTEAIG